MPYDLVIRNGTLVDGSGEAGRRADVAVADGRIAEIGLVREPAREEIDADGRVVAPGFVDGHTHMDAQVAWDRLGSCSCYHGVTSVVMGNCGFTVAPLRRGEEDLVIGNLERAEDISADAMRAGIDFSWETFAEYLDAVERLPKAINYAGYVGHSALRTYAMRERAFEEAPTDAELACMRDELRAAVRAGAMGLSTSRSKTHVAGDGRPVASRVARWDEVRALAGVLGELGAGLFEIAGETVDDDPERRADYQRRLLELAVETGRPVTWGVFNSTRAPDVWRTYMALLDATAEAGGHMFAQVHCRPVNVIHSFETHLPFDGLPVWRELRARPLDEQRRALADPARGGELARAASALEFPGFDRLLVMREPSPPHRSVAELAREQGIEPGELVVEEALASDLKRLFTWSFTNDVADATLEMMKHPRSVVTFSDSGAHVSQIMDSSLQTHVLSHWVRREGALTLEEAVRMLSFDTASAWGIAGRGLVREGWAADLIVFDPETVAPAMPEVAHDLPAGARRLVQRAVGISTTVVNGEVTLRDGEPTGATPGRLLRGGASTP